MKDKRQKVKLERSGQCMCIKRGSEGPFTNCQSDFHFIMGDGGRPMKRYLPLWLSVPTSNPLETSFPQSSPEALDSGIYRDKGSSYPKQLKPEACVGLCFFPSSIPQCQVWFIFCTGCLRLSVQRLSLGLPEPSLPNAERGSISFLMLWLLANIASICKLLQNSHLQTFRGCDLIQYILPIML